MLLAGKYLDLWKNLGSRVEVYGFLSVFLIAVICGVISLQFLKKIPDLEKEKSKKADFNFWKMIKIPFGDSNFLSFTLFCALWSFSVNLASPFFVVYMLKDLQMSYALLALVTILNEISTILSLPLWGRLSDRFGSKPVLSLTTLSAALLPMLWVLTISRHFVLIIIILQLYGGLFWSGLNLNNNNLLLKLAPKENNSIYLATFAALTGLATAVAPVLGGFLANELRGTTLNLGYVKIYDLLFLFLISGFLRLVSRIFLQKVTEPKEKPVGRMIRALGRLGTLNVTKGFEPLLNYVYLATSRITDFIEKKENSPQVDQKNGS
jgi:MFS family permease